MTPAGTSNELDVQNKWEENTHTHSYTDLQYTTVVAPVTVEQRFTGGAAKPLLIPCSPHEKYCCIISNEIDEEMINWNKARILIAKQTYGVWYTDSSSNETRAM